MKYAPFGMLRRPIADRIRALASRADRTFCSIRFQFGLAYCGEESHPLL